MRSSGGYVLVFMTGILTLLLVAFLGQLSLRGADRSLAWARLRQAVARADARLALGRALEGLSEWPGMDCCATASGNIVSGSAQPHWTLCEMLDGTRAYLVTGLPDDSYAEADFPIVAADADSGTDEVSVPLESVRNPDGKVLCEVAWWVDDLGVKIPTAPADGRDAAALFADLSSSDAAEARSLLKTQIPGPLACGDAALCTGHNYFTLTDSRDGGLREDLSALATEDVSEYRNVPPSGWQAWMRTDLGMEDDALMTPDCGAARFVPVVTEFALMCGLGADNTLFKSYMSFLKVPILLSYRLYLEVWNPFSRKMEMSAKAQNDICVEVEGLPSVTVDWANASPTIALPDPLVIDVDRWGNLPVGTVWHLSVPEQDDDQADENDEVRQVEVGSVVLTKYNWFLNVTLHFSSSSPVLKFYLYDPNDPSEKTLFLTLSLPCISSFDMTYPFASNPFCRAASGMDFSTIRTAGWGFAWHVKLNEDELETLLRHFDLREPAVAWEASGTDEVPYSVLDDPSAFDRAEVTCREDFFATQYSKGGLAEFDSATNRQALFFDSPAGDCLSFGALRHAPWTASDAEREGDSAVSGHVAFSVGTGLDEEVDTALDRYFFSSLPDGDWDGSEPLRNYRIVQAERDTAVTRAPDDASGLLLEGGWNLNTASAEAWAAVLRSFAFQAWSMEGSSDPLDLEAPFFSMPWSAAHPLTDAAAGCIEAMVKDHDLDALDAVAHPLAENRRHPAFLVGVRDIGDGVDALAGEIADRITQRGRPFHSLLELAESGLLQAAIDAVPEINLRRNGVDSIPRGSSANLDQSELLCALSPILFTRSDCFLVRAYGKDARMGSSACVEAVVQRMPDAVGGDAVICGRRLKIVSMRWLREDELP